MGSEFVIFGFLATTAFTIYHLIKSKHIEQMTKIENGMGYDDESSVKPNLKQNLGILLTSLGTAIFTSYLVSYYTSIPNHISMPGFLLLFGGLGFLIANEMDAKRLK